MATEANLQNVRKISSQSGFTVIEVLISLLLLSLVLLVLPSTLRLATAVWTKGDTVEQDIAASMLVERLRMALQEAREEFARSSDGHLQLLFDGDADSLRFLAMATRGPAGGDLYRFDIRSTDDVASLRGVIFEQSNYRPTGAHAHAHDVQPSVRRRLSNTRLTFRYFGSIDGAENLQWQDHWRTRSKLPMLVAIRIETRRPGPPAVNTLIVPLKLGWRSAVVP